MNQEAILNERIEKINNLNNYYNTLPQTYFNEENPNPMLNSALPLFNKAMETHSKEDIALAIEEANKLDDANPYKNAIVDASKQMMDTYYNESFEDYQEINDNKQALEDGIARINNLNNYYNTLPQTYYNEENPNPMLNSALPLFNKALETHSKEDIVNAIEEANKLEDGNPYKNAILDTSKQMMSVYVNETYEDYQKEIQEKQGLEDSINRVNNLNNYYNSMPNTYFNEENPNPMENDALEAYNKALETHNKEDIISARERADSIIDSNPYRSAIIDATEKMMKGYTNTTYEDYQKGQENKELLEKGIARINNLNNYYNTLPQTYYNEENPNPMLNDAIPAYNKALETHNKEDIVNAIEEANKLVDTNPYKSELLNTLNLMETVYKDEVIQETVAPNVEEEMSTLTFDDNSKVSSVLNEMMKVKTETGKDVYGVYQNKKYDTFFAEDIDSLNCRYYMDIFNEYEDNKKEALNNRNIKIAVELFKISRGNRHNGMSSKQEVNNSIIKEKELEYSKLYSAKNNVNFENPKEACEWLNSLVPYVNTHALVLENGKDDIINTLKENNYTEELELDNVNIDTYYKDIIALKMQELEEYGFFITQYQDLPKDLYELNTEKTISMADLSYTRIELENAKKEKEVLQAKYDSYNEKYEKSQVLNRKIEIFKEEATDYMGKLDLIEYALKPSDNSILENNYLSKEEKEAVATYNELSMIPTEENFKTTIARINMLPNESGIKDELLKDTIKLLNNHALNVEDYDTMCNHAVSVGIDEMKLLVLSKPDSELEELKVKADKAINQRVEFLKKYKPIDISMMERELNETEKKLQNCNNTITELEQHIASFPQDVVESLDNKNGITKEEEEFDLTTPEVEVEDTNEEEFEFDLLDPQKDSTFNFTPIKSIKNISKNLYEKIKSVPYKEYAKKTVEFIKDHKVAVAIGAAAVAAIATLPGFTKLDNSNEQAKEEVKNESIETENTETKTNISEEASKAILAAVDKAMAEQEAVDTKEEAVSLEDLTQQAISNVANGNGTIYTSAYDAMNEQSGIDAKNATSDSWSNAYTNSYYTMEDGNLNKVEFEQAENLYNDGQDIVVGVENNGTGIGFVNLENESGKAR